MWEVIIEISAERVIRTVYKYNNIHSAEKIYSKVLNDWKHRYIKFPTTIFLVEEQKRVLKQRFFKQSDE